MSDAILNVGQCNVDGPRMKRVLEAAVGVTVDSADTLADAAARVAGGGYGLVLVNRQLAHEGTAGVDLIRAMKDKGDPTPVMLVSDRADAQAAAEAAGAAQGFGKSALSDPATTHLIRAALRA